MFDKNFLMMDRFEEEGNVIPVFSMNDDELKFDDEYKAVMPILALKNTVLFPGVVIPITVGRDKSIRALQKAEKSDKFLGVLTQKDVESEDPTPEGLHGTGTIARIIKILKMPDGSTTAILQGRTRFQAGAFLPNLRMLEAEVHLINDKPPVKNIEFNAIISTIRDYAKQIIELSPNIPSEAALMLQNIKNDSFL
jgi:ATP-dependent Lon protease